MDTGPGFLGTNPKYIEVMQNSLIIKKKTLGFE